MCNVNSNILDIRTDQLFSCCAGHLVRAATGCSPPEPANGKVVSSSQQKKRARATSLFGGCGRKTASGGMLCCRTALTMMQQTASVYALLAGDAYRWTRCPGPSPLVVMRLCCAGREFGKQLLQRLKAARQAFEEGETELLRQSATWQGRSPCHSSSTIALTGRSVAVEQMA